MFKAIKGFFHNFFDKTPEYFLPVFHHPKGDVFYRLCDDEIWSGRFGPKAKHVAKSLDGVLEGMDWDEYSLFLGFVSQPAFFSKRLKWLKTWNEVDSVHAKLFYASYLLTKVSTAVTGVMTGEEGTDHKLAAAKKMGLEARALLEACVDSHPHQTLVLLRLAATYVATGDVATAKKYCQQALDVQPHNIFAHLFMMELVGPLWSGDGLAAVQAYADKLLADEDVAPLFLIVGCEAVNQSCREPLLRMDQAHDEAAQQALFDEMDANYKASASAIKALYDRFSVPVIGSHLAPYFYNYILMLMYVADMDEGKEVFKILPSSEYTPSPWSDYFSSDIDPSVLWNMLYTRFG